MADTAGDQAPSLKSIFENPERFSFFQIVRLLKRFCDHSGVEPPRLIITPELSLDYPQSEIAAVSEIAEENAISVLTTFLGLYGASSPLPAFYTEDLIHYEQEEESPAKAILDLIHQRIYHLCFEAMKKYRPLYGVVEDRTHYYPKLLASLMGMRTGIAPQEDASDKTLRYAGLFSQQPRSATGLKTLLEDAISGVDVEVDECARRLVKIPKNQQLTLGESRSGLGENCYLGNTIEDYTGKIVITFGPLTWDQFNTLLNSGPEWNYLLFLIQFYLSLPLECDLIFILAENQAQPMKLGVDGGNCCLGKDTWLLSGGPSQPVSSVFRLHLSGRPVIN